jgi:hypothetical protein
VDKIWPAGRHAKQVRQEGRKLSQGRPDGSGWTSVVFVSHLAPLKLATCQLGAGSNIGSRARIGRPQRGLVRWAGRLASESGGAL